MVLLVITPLAHEAIRICRDAVRKREETVRSQDSLPSRIFEGVLGNTVEHHNLIELSRLIKGNLALEEGLKRKCRLDALLKGASIYQAPPPPKPEPTPEYKALMKRLREQEEQKQYERMINPAPALENFNQPFANSKFAFNPATSHGKFSPEEADEVTFADVNRQLTLIINILLSIICCSVAIWIAARRWTVPQRLGLSMSGSGLVAVAEVAIYLGYIRRIKDSKTKEVKRSEKKEIIDSWVIDKSSSTTNTLLVTLCTDRGTYRGMSMAPKDFHHPFQPYAIQQQFMEAVFDCIENKKVGIFESPTGTGKSLSLICGSLTWLRETRRKAFDNSLASVDTEDDEPDWMIEYAREARRKEASQMRDDFEARLKAVREKEHQIRRHRQNGEPLRKRHKREDHEPPRADSEDEFVLDDYEEIDTKTGSDPIHDHYSSETRQLLKRLGLLQKPQGGADQVEMPDEMKIYFCSRTHSQLSQFVGELGRVTLPPGIPLVGDTEEQDSGRELVESLKHISLGSRKNLCINPKVNKLSSQTAINERCVELQQGSKTASQGCSFLPKKEDESLLLDFRDHALAKVRDIEDLANLGRELEICPYYASRPAILPAEIVTLPYPLLLQRTAREALGINLRDHVVIIDEAHNLLDAIEGISSCEITTAQLRLAKDSLITYLQRFKNRLKGANRIYVAQVIRVLDSLLLYTKVLEQEKANGGTVEASQLLSGKAVDQIDLNKLVRYMAESKLARKVEGYIANAEQQHISKTTTRKAVGAVDVPNLAHLQNFLGTLMNPAKEGRFFWAKQGSTYTIRYMLLDPSEHFRDIVEDARAVILAGGTMSPIDDYKQQLFPYLSSLSTLSCGHIIPSSNLLVRAVPSDSGGPLEFNFKSRSSDTTVSRLGQALDSIAQRVQGGMVVFFASYTYLDDLIRKWQEDRTLSKLQGSKPVYCDGRLASADTIFKEYSQAVRGNPEKGALLLSVIGGKLSEGINFSDSLGRCVVVVGLPYPNLETPEWKTKLQYLEEKAAARGEPNGRASREHAENVCMRAVNQAIGRVIRHQNDWASIVLLGAPYTQARIQAKLPGWIRANLPPEGQRNGDGVEAVAKDLKTFFSQRKVG
ncbi:DNA repair helicase [Polychaeton citri CBS 116435]|uniref:ATP-dependent DNA helicase CHL1 n=1 Tax=Polychaeton citri CBS 116435 TaxID=1314669 RepID=A0A9P4URV5_9PEZI|nr:DNA repair helicase [Polychaeton citri CBS 116435]